MAAGEADPGGAASRARARLLARLLAAGVVRSAPVRSALGRVPREVFLPGRPLGEAYADAAVEVKREGAVSLSTVPQPTMVAIMLELLDVPSRARVLEVGTGVGYTAALLAELVGPAGTVTSIEIDPELAGTARGLLSRLGYRQVRVLTGDGRGGWPPGAPYDRVLATACGPAVPPAWCAQLAEGGLVVAPLTEPARVDLLRRLDARLEVLASVPGRFLTLRDR